MRIYVTKHDIANGRQCNSGKCPVARSLQRRFPRRFVSVGPLGGMVGAHTHVLWPKAVQKFIKRFDYRPLTARPFSFTLDI